MNVADEVVIASERDLESALASLAGEKRMVFFAGLPGVGKSLFIRELAQAAHGAGRTVHLLQWDVVRPAFVTPAIDARYPEVDGLTHAMIRKAVGIWSRAAAYRWHQEHDAGHILVGEVPLIGCRLLDLVQVQADTAEALLGGPDVVFATPVPSVAIRNVIEGARGRTFANPTHARESADAPPPLMRRAWQEVHRLAVKLGATTPMSGEIPFDPQAYAAVYRHLLRHRHALMVSVNVPLQPGKSVYALDVAATELVPRSGEAEELVARLEMRFMPEQIERDVAGWFDQV
jgi:hypothetical protein